MNPRRISVRKYNFKNTENNNEEKPTSKCFFQTKNKNNIYNIYNDDKHIKFILLKNNETPKEYNQQEDDYDSQIYDEPISKYKYFYQESEYDFRFNTISNFGSFELKNKYLLIFNRPRKDKNSNNKSNINDVALFYDLNLSFEANRKNLKNNIFMKTKRKIIDKNLNFFDRIINVFDKNHKKMRIKYYKNKKTKLKYLNKSKIKTIYYNSNINYIKIQKNSKFSKKNKNRGLRKNYSSLMDSHLKVDSQNFNENIEKLNKIPHQIHEINNKISTTDKKDIFHKIEYKNKNTFKKNKNINSITSVAKNLFNTNPSPNQSTSSKSNQIKYEDEFDRNKKIKNENIYIGLNKKNIIDKSKNSNDINTSNNNQNSKILFRYSNRKSNSIIADNSINNNKNNGISINESGIKKEKEKKEYFEKRSPKSIYKKYENLKKIKEEKEKEKEKEYNTNVNNKRYKKIINTNINRKV